MCRHGCGDTSDQGVYSQTQAFKEPSQVILIKIADASRDSGFAHADSQVPQEASELGRLLISTL